VQYLQKRRIIKAMCTLLGLLLDQTMSMKYSGVLACTGIPELNWKTASHRPETIHLKHIT